MTSMDIAINTFMVYNICKANKGLAIMKIKHLKINEDGVEREEIHIEGIKDVRYHSPCVDLKMTLADANLLSAELDKIVSKIPF